jgi:hypothetical protein
VVEGGTWPYGTETIMMVYMIYLKRSAWMPNIKRNRTLHRLLWRSSLAEVARDSVVVIRPLEIFVLD